jgi:hypothetical protein
MNQERVIGMWVDDERLMETFSPIVCVIASANVEAVNDITELQSRRFKVCFCCSFGIAFFGQDFIGF